MADGIVQLQADSTGKKVDTSELTVGANTVERQRINIADPASAAAIAAVKAGSTPATAADAALVVSFDDANSATRIGDGINTVSVKPPSTAVAAADAPLAVALHPSSPLPTGSNVIGAVSAPAIVKGTQGATGFSVQDLKDAGRTAICLFASSAAAGASGVETALTLTKSAGAAANVSAASFVVTSGKTFRVTSISVATRGHATATAQATTFSLRLNAAGAVTTTSTPVLLQARSATPATASAWDRVIVPIPDGFEIAGNGSVQIGVTANSVYTTNAPTWDVAIIGYEY